MVMGGSALPASAILVEYPSVVGKLCSDLGQRVLVGHVAFDWESTYLVASSSKCSVTQPPSGSLGAFVAIAARPLRQPSNGMKESVSAYMRHAVPSSR